MKTRVLILSMIGMFLIALIVSCTPSSPLPEPETSDPEALIIDKCSDCHTADRIFSADYSEDGWMDVIDEMIEKGAEVTNEEKEIMIEWLLSRN